MPRCPKLTAYLVSPEERQRILALAQDLPTRLAGPDHLTSRAQATACVSW